MNAPVVIIRTFTDSITDIEVDYSSDVITLNAK